MTKLLQFYSNYLAATRGERGGVRSPLQDSSVAVADTWKVKVISHYTPSTLERMLSSYDAKTRRAAAWALQHHGDDSHAPSLGLLLRDRDHFTRKTADAARRAIQQRSQSPIQQQIVAQAEQCMMQGSLVKADSLTSLLIDEADQRSEIYSLRAFIRFAMGRIEQASNDCKTAIQLDRFAYQSFVALGQCYWHQLNNGAARECYLEAARIYPDCRPALAGIELVGQ